MDDERVILKDRPSDVKGFVCEDGDGFHTVYINSRLNYEQVQAAYQHEEAHIRGCDLHRNMSADCIEYERHGDAI